MQQHRSTTAGVTVLALRLLHPIIRHCWFVLVLRVCAKALNRFAIVAAVGRPERCPQGRVRWRAIAGACLMDLSLNLLEHGAVRMIGHRTIRNFTPKILGLLCQ